MGPERWSKGFRECLGERDVDVLEKHAGAVFGLWSDFTLAYFNEAWFRFAGENGGEPQISQQWALGRSVFESIPEPLKAFYESLYARALASSPSAIRALGHAYECSSAGVERRFSIHLYPLDDTRGILAVNSLLFERPHDPGERSAREPRPDRHVDDDGLIHQCAHCRRIRVRGQEHSWDWVPQWVDEPDPRTSHDLCEICLAYYYPVAS